MLGDRLRSNGVNSEAYDIIVKYTASGIIGAYADWLRSDERIPIERLIETLGGAMSKSLVF